MEYLEQIQSICAQYGGNPVPEALLVGLLGNGRLVHFGKGDLIIASGDQSSLLYILLAGACRKYALDSQGNDITHMFLLENSVFSSDYVMIQQASFCNLEALEHCKAIVFDYPLVKERMAREPALLQIYVGILESTLRKKILRENALLSQCATQRYLDLKRDIPGIERRASQAHIASYIGITPVSLSRIRRTLREENG